MLVLSRKAGEGITIDDQIKICILSTHGKQVKVGIEAPAEIRILRDELCARSLLATEAPQFLACVER